MNIGLNGLNLHLELHWLSDSSHIQYVPRKLQKVPLYARGHCNFLYFIAHKAFLRKTCIACKWLVSCSCISDFACSFHMRGKVSSTKMLEHLKSHMFQLGRVHQMAKFTLETNNHPHSHMFLDCGKKLEYPERTQADTGRTCKRHKKGPGRIFMLWGG